MGLLLSKIAIKLREVIKIVPLEKLLIETDSPYLAPQSKRGKTNEPSYIPEIAQMVAQIKNLSVQEIANITKNNLLNLLKL